MLETMALIEKNRKRLTRQQLRTLLGQCRAGDPAAAERGLLKILRRSEKGEQRKIY